MIEDGRVWVENTANEILLSVDVILAEFHADKAVATSAAVLSRLNHREERKG